MDFVDDGLFAGAAIRPESYQSQEYATVLQRKCAACQEEDPAQRKAPAGRPLEGRYVPGSIQTAGLQGTPDMPVRLPEYGGGTEIPEDVRGKMDAAFGVDFSPVRIHEGSHVEALGALAYTKGTDIHFAPGLYQPRSARGQQLLGHELTHVVQQSQGRVRATAQVEAVDLNDDPALEREADDMGARAARGERRASPGPVPAPQDGSVTQQAISGPTVKPISFLRDDLPQPSSAPPRAAKQAGSHIVLAEIPIGGTGGGAVFAHTDERSGPMQRKEPEDVAPESETPSEAPANQSRVRDHSRLKPGIDVSASEARWIVDTAIAAMSPHGATVKPFAGDLIAANEPGPSAPIGAIQAAFAPTQHPIQRSSSSRFKPEAGFVGALQLCYDLCSSELSVIGWIWAGGGVVTKGVLGGEAWWGAYVFAEKEFGRWKLDFMPSLKCGTCQPECKAPEDGKGHWGAGIAGFPLVIKPGEKATLGKAGIEVGLLLTPHLARCDADLEVIALIDLTKYLGPVGAAVTSAAELATKMGKKYGIEVSCGVGVAVSGSAHLCKSVPGGGILGITSDSAKICGGGYVGCGIGLAHDKSALPGI